MSFESGIPSISQNNTNLKLRPLMTATLRCASFASQRSGNGSGFSWQEGLPERIVADLEALNDDKDGVLPIHLQIVCYGLWELLAADENEITAAHYDGAADGSPRSASTSPAAAMVHQRIIVPLEHVRGHERQRWLCRLLRELITGQGTKALRKMSTLRKIVPKNHLMPLLIYLESNLLLRRENAEHDTYYELRHDYLSRAISEWLGAKEQVLKDQDRRRRNTGMFILLMVFALFTLLIGRWYSYEAFIGFDEKREDELIIKRHAVFGEWSPVWWNREIDTGFGRSQLLAGGLPQHSFSLGRALSDWKEVEQQLNFEGRRSLQLATRLPSDSAKLIDLLDYYDITLYAAADSHVRNHVISASKSGNAYVKGSAVRTLRNLGKNLPDSPSKEAVIDALLQALKDQDSSVKSSAAYALSDFGNNFPADPAGKVITDALLEALKSLKEQDS